jgi:hypothetical protein
LYDATIAILRYVISPRFERVIVIPSVPFSDLKLDCDLLLYDLTSTYFEGLAEENDLASRGYSRDHRSDCKQVVVALVVTRDGFPLAHRTLAGNTQDLQTVEKIVTEVEQLFGKTDRIWVVDRGMVSKQSPAFLKEPERRYVVASRRGEISRFQTELQNGGWQRLPNNVEVEIKLLKREEEHYLLARSKPRRKKGPRTGPRGQGQAFLLGFLVVEGLKGASPVLWPVLWPAVPALLLHSD